MAQTHDVANPDDEEQSSFESVCHVDDQGRAYWSGREFMALLGYTDWQRFKATVIQRATAACLALDVPLDENFREVTIDGVRDLHVTRFACYLIAMNADGRRAAVAQAQGYLARLAEAFEESAREADHVDRLLMREEVSEREKSLSSTVNSRGIINFAYFKDAGYRGMYNMRLRDLQRHKGVDTSRVLFDFMGREELAANLFRITQTEAKIKNEGIRGQSRLENAATPSARQCVTR